MTLSEFIKQYREEHKMSMDDFAKVCDLSKPYISMLEKNKNSKNGKKITPSIRTYSKIAKGVGMSLNAFMEMMDGNDHIHLGDDSPSLPAGTFKPIFKKVPLLGYVAAGKPLEDLNQDVSYVDVEGKYDVDFCVKVVGDSMVDVDINDGDIVFAKSMPEVENGQIAVVEIDHEKACLKRFYRSNGTITLISANPKYPPMVFTAENCESVEVKGLTVIKQSEIH